MRKLQQAIEELVLRNKVIQTQIDLCAKLEYHGQINVFSNCIKENNETIDMLKTLMQQGFMRTSRKIYLAFF